MCGVAGAISYNPDRPLTTAVAETTLRLFCDGMRHRGPDGEGTWTDHLDASPAANRPAVALAHRRLAVIDPRPRSGQPFVGAGGNLVVVFNGEIFNFRQLRSELGGDWQTDGDTEVLLAAYERWGEGCVDRLDGMFAFAIYDARTSRPSLFLARDAAGEKPLFFGVSDGTALFASELRPLRRAAAKLGWCDLSINADSLREYLAWGYIPGEMTIHRGVEKLPPGCCMTIDAGGLTRRRYFDAGGRFEADGVGRHASAVTRTRTLVGAAVEKRLVSDVPIGCLLSGGIDSSVVALHMRRATGSTVDTFSIGFDGVGSAGYDESAYAAEVANHLDCRHHVFRVSPATFDAAGDLPRLIESLGEPFADSSILPTRVLAEKVRGHVTVALGGDGGDELFGGYDRYRALQLANRLEALPLGKRAASVATSLLDPIVSRLGEKNPVRRAMRLAGSVSLGTAERYASYMRIFPHSRLRWMTPGGMGGLSATLLSRDAAGRVGGRWFDAFVRGNDVAAAATAVDRATYLPGDLLVKVDRASMLHGLEVRSPFVDRDLIQFAASLGDNDLIGPRGGKRLLRDAFANSLPSGVFSRKKRGFAVPIGAWLRGPLRSMLRDLVLADDSLASEWFDPTAVGLLIEDHEAGRQDHGHALFALMMLELWWRDARDDVPR